MKDLNHLIEELEKEFYDSKGFLWSKKSFLDVEKCASIMQQIKASIPSSVSDINYLQTEKHRLINQAERIIQEAEFRARQLVSETELVKRAEAEVERIKENAALEIKKYENNAMTKLSTMLCDIESFLLEAINLVRNSREDVDQNIRLSMEKEQAKKLTPLVDSKYMSYDELIDSIKK